MVALEEPSDLRPPERARVRHRDGRTGDRIVAAALEAFGNVGIQGTSLDAVAREVGVTKQAVLYWYPSKEALLDAVIDFCADEVHGRFTRALDGAPDGFDRVEVVVRVGFRLAARHPAMVGLIREVNRIGPPTSARLTDAATPLLEAAAAWLAAEMDAGRLRRHDPKLLVLMAYSLVTGLSSEVEVLRAMGEDLTLTGLIRRRDHLIALLRDALVRD